MSESIDSLPKLLRAFQDYGVRRLFYKRLAPNDNSKQQVYLGASFDVINILPFQKIAEDISQKRPNFKAALNFCWLDREGILHGAPHSQIILYPDYPEVRFSGFLKGCKNGPSQLMRAYPRPPEGRILFLGIRTDEKIIGHVVSPQDPIAVELSMSERVNNTSKVFNELELVIGIHPRTELLQILKAIHDHQWYVGRRLSKGGTLINPYTARNAGGYTLEALFGIIPNGISEPDFKGWELKCFKTRNITATTGGRLTLMTPEPTLGFYAAHGADAFVRRFGHVGKKEDTLYFTGTHKVGEVCRTSKLRMQLDGFDFEAQKITDVGGGIHLFTDSGALAAGWAFKDVLAHWNRKHSQAAYIPYIAKKTIPEEYWFGQNVLLAEGADVEKFLFALATKKVIYDPGVKIEQASTSVSRIKARSQFRINSNVLGALYHQMTVINLSSIQT